MNSEKIVELLLDGAYQEGNKFFHPTFRKGYRTISSSNISFQSAMNKLAKMGKIISYQNDKYFL
jgi:hypothetical protein